MKIVENIATIKSNLATELDALNRSGEEIILVAVSKTHPVEAVEAALKAGITDFGENKVQEAMRKVPLLTTPYHGFHFIGHLQTNKINQLLSLKPWLIHSVDSLHLALNLHKALGRTNRYQDILVQINSSKETSKQGFDFEEAEAAISRIAAYSSMRIMGLMTIGQLGAPELSRPLFKKMKELFDYLKAQDIPGVEMRYLSMGMSHDYLIALQEGSNMLRIGSAIFGERNYGGTL